MEQFPNIPEQPDDYEQAREINELTSDCQDLLEQDKRYETGDKRVRVIGPEWAGQDGVHFQPYLKGMHIMSPAGNYVGQAFELGLNAAYPVFGIVPRELEEQVAKQGELLPDIEKIHEIEASYQINIFLDIRGGISWQESRHYDVCHEVDKDDVPEESLQRMACETDEEDNEEHFTTEESYIVQLSGGSSYPAQFDPEMPDVDILMALDAEVATIQPPEYIEFGRKILLMVIAEDEGNLALSRIFPDEVLRQILHAK